MLLNQGMLPRRCNVCCNTGVPLTSRYCLGRSAPMRRPLPAAGSTRKYRASVGTDALIWLLSGRSSLGGNVFLVDEQVVGFTPLDQPQLAARVFFHGVEAS